MNLDLKSSQTSPLSSPVILPTSQFPSSSLSLPSTSAYATASTSSLQRHNSRTSHHSGLIPSPHAGNAPLIATSVTPSASSSASGSKPASLISTPRLLSRRSSTKDNQRGTSTLLRRHSSKSKGKGREDEESHQPSGFPRLSDGQDGWRSPISETESVEV